MSVFHVGLDVGSTTAKLVVLDRKFNTVYSIYRRHNSDIQNTVKEILLDAYSRFKNQDITMMVTGSGGMGVSKWLNIPFIQEVVASTKGIEVMIPHTDVAIELGGEDAKITYLKGSKEMRMNSICAGGTGAFIDQMAALLHTDAKGLNDYAKNHKGMYSIASRCGVFAKTDIQALMNQGVSSEDISISVFQAVVNQTISNLACGRPIEGNVAFLGGPLHFLDQLRERFIETLELKEEEIIHPENSQLYIALGAAISSIDQKLISFIDLEFRVKFNDFKIESEVGNLKTLFEDEEDYRIFKERHEKNKIDFVKDPKEYTGKAYLGIDAGSTTTKAILLNEEDEILYSFYGSNEGKPLQQSIEILTEIYETLPNAQIIASASTGYGERLIKSALKIDYGEVETLAHFRGAQYFMEDLDFIIDIGGQDMKAIKIRDGIIDDILLNEACSSGCGSFIQTFAQSVDMSVEEFTKKGLFAKNPVDLGSRCTVFMNSMVRQAQKEGSTIEDISAGISNSVIRNAIEKVIKIRDPKEFGENIIVQGGTFYGDAVLRSFERIIGREVIRPNIAGLMGALGAALIAKDHYLLENFETDLLSYEEVKNFNYKSSQAKCNKCTNNCNLTINIFSNGESFIMGNRCERGAGIELEEYKLPNLFKYKEIETFNYESLSYEEAKRGAIGIPRVLNIFENYPFWHTFFTDLGFKVVLSDKSTRETYEDGIATIPSETACYPAKISHGHIVDLVEKGVRRIFMPSVFYENKEYSDADNNLNCPVVASYSEVLRGNMPELDNIDFRNPFITLNDKKSLAKELYRTFKDLSISRRDINRAVNKGLKEYEDFTKRLMKKGEDTVKYLKENNLRGIVLAGRPYHVDGAINHGISELINSLGLAVLTEDSIAHIGKFDHPLRVLDQWTYHSRLYRSAAYVAETEELDLIQLVSFGCGLDAVTSDQVSDILKARGKIYTQLKIDEISNLGAATIRVRSLMAALKERENSNVKPLEEAIKIDGDIIPFTEEDKLNHTILMPSMLPIQFSLMEEAMRKHGYNIEVLNEDKDDIIREGLKYVHNDACYPSIIVVGQFISALKSGRYDLDNVSLLMSQTGGMCRASNYIGFIRKALKDAGFEDIPVIAISAQGIEENAGFKITFGLVNDLLKAILLGDLLMRCSLRVRPYEKIKNSTNILVDNWVKRLRKEIHDMKMFQIISYAYKIIKDFELLELDSRIEEKPIVGIVGEILVKYDPIGNNNLVDVLENEGAEVILGDLIDFISYALYNTKFKADHLGKSRLINLGGKLVYKYIERYRDPIRKRLEESSRFRAPKTIYELADMASEIASLGNQSGEGWLLVAEMVELVEMGAGNIVCVQPFGCLPNHIVGKGMIKSLREINPMANVVALDYDPGASEVNQLNRIKLMLSTAEENLRLLRGEKHNYK